MRRILVALVGVMAGVGTAVPAGAQTPAPVAPVAPVVEGDITPVHDPTIVREGDSWYLFSTNDGMVIRPSDDLRHWERVGQVFPGTPVDVTGRWHLTNYPQECPMRSVDDARLTLHDDGSVSPSGRWEADGDVLRITGVQIGDQTRVWSLFVDQANETGFGRDDRTAAVRAERVADGPDAVSTQPCGPEAPPPPPATPIVRPPEVTA